MDYLDFIRSTKAEEVLTGTYYVRRPLTTQDVGIRFNYDIVDESDRSYSTLLNNIEEVYEIQTIKTSDLKDVNVKGYVVTQDGVMWQVSGAIKRLINQNSKQALRFLKRTNETEYIMRLVKVENPWGLK